MWSVFVEALRSSFGTKVGKEQAITEWLTLQYSTSIDDYLDTLINLVWRTGYLEEVAKDKLVRGLNKEVGLAWAQIPNKPEKLEEQMTMLRDIGHNLESFHFWQKDIPTGFSRQKEQNKQNHKNKSPQSQNDGNGKRTGKKRKREEKDWKYKDVELVGIPTDILEERKKADFCLKCGKNAHK